MENFNHKSFKHTWQVSKDSNPQRLDVFLMQQMPVHSRTYFKHLIDNNQVQVNNKLGKASLLVKPEDIVHLTIPHVTPSQSLSEAEKAVLKNFNVSLIYTHKDFLIIDKPSGIMTHKPTAKSTELTLTDWLINHFSEMAQVGCAERPGIVHRLDKGTSGIMIVARNNYAHHTFTNMFKNRTVHKLYYALVHGHPEKTGTIDAPIGRDPIKRNQMTINGINARHATTHYRVIEYFNESSLLALSPVTGRTHQIRVHCTYLGHPLIGDKVYGQASKFITRQSLHAYQISFTFEGQQYSFTSEIPYDLREILAYQKKAIL